MKDPLKFPKKNPFGVPDGYFDMLDERIEGMILEEQSKGNSKTKIIRLVKPLVGLAASFILVYLLVSYPLRKTIPLQYAIQSSEEVAKPSAYIPDVEKDILADPFYIDESSFFEALSGDDSYEDLDSDEIISIVASEIDDYDIYAGIIF